MKIIVSCCPTVQFWGTYRICSHHHMSAGIFSWSVTEVQRMDAPIWLFQSQYRNLGFRYQYWCKISCFLTVRKRLAWCFCGYTIKLVVLYFAELSTQLIKYIKMCVTRWRRLFVTIIHNMRSTCTLTILIISYFFLSSVTPESINTHIRGIKVHMMTSPKLSNQWVTCQSLWHVRRSWTPGVKSPLTPRSTPPFSVSCLTENSILVLALAVLSTALLFSNGWFSFQRVSVRWN